IVPLPKRAWHRAPWHGPTLDRVLPLVPNLHSDLESAWYRSRRPPLGSEGASRIERRRSASLSLPLGSEKHRLQLSLRILQWDWRLPSSDCKTISWEQGNKRTPVTPEFQSPDRQTEGRRAAWSRQGRRPASGYERDALCLPRVQRWTRASSLCLGAP